MATSRREASTTVSSGVNQTAVEITPAFCCHSYFSSTIFFSLVSLGLLALAYFISRNNACYLELFTHSLSVSNANANANVSTADWTIGLVAKSPVTGCKISLHTIKSRLLRGDEVISVLPMLLDSFGQLVTSDKTDKPVTNIVFKTVVTPGVISGVVWDYRVEIVAGVKANGEHGFLMVFCGDLPVRFTAVPVGNVIGSLLGNMRRCDYLFRDKLDISG